VKFSDGKPGSSIPRFAWYGEGNWNGLNYCHVGKAVYVSSNLVGSASDIYGNAENINNNFSESLKLQLLSSSIIRVTSACNEEWRQ
jgi:hypothetical protein